MTQCLTINAQNPQARLLAQAGDALRAGAVIAFPTDSCYALGCHLGDKAALDRLRAIRAIDERHHLTLMCRDLSDIAKYARVDNRQYRLLKANTPGSYVFILEGAKELPRRVMHPKRKTIGLRIPDHPVAQSLLAELGEPLLTATLLLPGEDAPPTEAWRIQEALEGRVGLVLDSGHCGAQATTVIDLTSAAPELVRAGRGALEPFGFSGMNGHE
ncbi:MAG: threonylcarbamoyl-AMP synthase [Zoogloeaceae bacterium]|jgi:tRNA threonylcarbamoyl adenosine modification protein (Sua5/YciO/YrdC/YwlC family)|nr:threonylcarbamoyl-AMP synthase [Zoogloeaceae bacterium]